ncbi:MAG TPA: TetR/AcrR family transcriptional regulator [Pseudonocardiaceae bacterium]|nr:TetR/AcrR family transcriptional regulator [Pseudonocardiaceae bacterium]
MDGEPGLRERKKRETRQRISDVATVLFVTRGFDSVTVADIAAEADVSRVTVFNYFRRKEDMFFDRHDEARALFTGAVRDRQPGESIPAALRRVLLDLADRRHPLSGLRDGIEPFVRTVRDSPTLQAAARENREALARDLAESIAQDTGAEPADPLPTLVASAVLAAYRTAYRLATEGVLAGESAAALWPRYRDLVNTAFDMLEHGVGDYGRSTVDAVT